MELAPLIAAALLAAVFASKVGAGALDGVDFIQKIRGRRLVSAAAGVSVAYVFMDILPELAAQAAVLQRGNEGERLFAEQRIYLLTLISFVVMYGLDHIVLSRRDDRREQVERGERDATYWLHLIGYAAYSALIGYLLDERAERGTAALAAYVMAMAIHFIVVSHAMAEEHGSLYERHGHWVLAASVLAGWAVGAGFEISEVTFAHLFAALAGGVVITSLRSELPNERDGRFWPFCAGAVVFAAVLMLA